MTDEFAPGLTEIECPHCRRRFHGKLIDGGAARYVGFKCPFCRLFVPLERVREDGEAPKAGRGHARPGPASTPHQPADPERPRPK